MELSEDQKKAYDTIQDWYKDPTDYLTMGGFAGTGKSSLITTIRKDFGKIKVAFCAFTGKAASVLKLKFKEKNYSEDFVGTIHSLIYIPIVDKKTKRIKGWRKQIELDFDLIVIDEASMVDEVLFRDLESFGIPILAVGDHGQLPPIGSQFSLMADPHIKLEKLHRFAENDALIRVSVLAREEGRIPFKEFSNDIKKIRLDEYRKSSKFAEYLKENNPLESDSIILCAYNRTRQSLNKWTRKILEFDKIEPMKKDRVICIRNNKKSSPPIYNGQLGAITNISGGVGNMYLTDIKLDGMEYEYYGLIDGRPFAGEDFDTYDRKRKVDFFDFGYCITVHKSQGSQFENVMLVEQECGLWEHNRWLYTGVTRASKKLLILGE